MLIMNIISIIVVVVVVDKNNIIIFDIFTIIILNIIIIIIIVVITAAVENIIQIWRVGVVQSPLLETKSAVRQSEQVARNIRISIRPKGETLIKICQGHTTKGLSAAAAAAAAGAGGGVFTISPPKAVARMLGLWNCANASDHSTFHVDCNTVLLQHSVIR